ncbi:nucleotide sugar dehydrogenase [Lachnospiraceae bacterium ZAX-1]
MYEKLQMGKGKLALVGLGYVGLPIAVAFAKKVNVIGFDNNQEKIKTYQSGVDPTHEVGNAQLKNTNIDFTWEEQRLKEADFIIVAVPTPIHGDKTPDLTPVIQASRTVGRNLKKDSIVVFESTVYPGVTQEICLPILEQESGMTCGKDFYIGYSPERINPGDKKHTLPNIKKIVSGMDEDTLEVIARVYEMVIEVGVHRARSIKVAEAAKLVENAQRDINVAFMNELSMVFERMDISTSEVLDAMNTKWNALGFSPGLVGGHCIGVDPYYFIYQAEKLGCHSQLIAAGRKINDDMPIYIAEMIVKQMILADIHVNGARVCVMGATFKENCPDIRNSKTRGIIKHLEEYQVQVRLSDPLADKQEVMSYFKQDLIPFQDIVDADCVVFTAAHQEFRELSDDQIKHMFRKDRNTPLLVIDIRNLYDKKRLEQAGFRYWSL